MKVEILKHPTEEDWNLCQTCTLVTVWKKPVKAPTDAWKTRLLKANHSPIRTLQFCFRLTDMQKMNDKCAEWKAAENIDYSLYGTPIESTTYKFAKCLQSRFGVIEGITDKNYITNSYHVHVTEKINAFDKLRFESEFQQLSPGGAISYIETANLSDNVEAALSVIKYIYYHIMYAELNTKSDFCQECGYDGEIQIVENDDGKLIWKCPNCGNTNRTKMNIARRTCGYIGVNDFNQGRTQEIKERYVHLGGE